MSLFDRMVLKINEGNFTKTIIRLRLSEYLGKEYPPATHFDFGELLLIIYNIQIKLNKQH
mgnify:CR=1 FL=1